MSDTNRHWMGSSRRVNKLLSKNSDVSKQIEFFKKKEVKAKEVKKEEQQQKEERKECVVEEPPRKKFDMKISMNMLALCENFEALVQEHEQEQEHENENEQKHENEQK